MTENIDGVPEPRGAANRIETDYSIGQDNIETHVGPFRIDMHNPVFVVSGLVIVAFVIVTLVLGDQAKPIFEGMRTFLTATFDWFFLGAADLLVLFALLLIVLPVGKVRIGGANAKPEFGYLAWFSMLFAAGMGIGLIFYGVAEPITHYNSSMNGADAAPLGGAEGDRQAAERLGMAATFYHWGLHPWAIYAVMALALSLFAYNKGLPLTMRSVFYPVFGDRIWGWPGHLIDILAVFSTLFGLTTSLGIGAQQATAGLAELFGSGAAEEGTRQLWGFTYGNPEDSGAQNSKIPVVILISAITAVAVGSVIAGLHAGVKRLSKINMVLAVLLLIFVVAVGPTLSIITSFFANSWAYIAYLPELSMPFGREDDGFRQGWTSFYWAWWISVSPFVGMFIARVSRGRTVREFLTCVILIPSLVCMLWMTTFGETALYYVVDQGVGAISDAKLELKLYAMLEQIPLSMITSFVAVVLVIVFFVTSSDSGSLVIDAITAGGKVDAPVVQRIFWATFEGLVAIVLLLGGGLTALQAMVVSTGFPFTFVLLLACYAIWRGLRSEPVG